VQLLNFIRVSRVRLDIGAVDTGERDGDHSWLQRIVTNILQTREDVCKLVQSGVLQA
jgi:hypothetical protein